MDPFKEHQQDLTRRLFFNRSGISLGSAALAWMLHNEKAQSKSTNNTTPTQTAHTDIPHFKPRAKRIIYLFQSGAPSQMDLFDFKPTLQGRRATELPDSIRRGQRLTGMTSKQDSFPVAPTIFQFKQHGQSGNWISELMPHLGEMADQLCFIKSMHTEAINHDPAITFFQTGAQLAGRPSMGSWISYGMGSANSDLPTFVAMVSGSGGQPLYDRLWGSGFLPTRYQGTKFRSVGDPVLFLANPPGINQNARRHFLDYLTELNQLKLQQAGDPEISTRIAQYEMAYRMQTSVPELTKTDDEPEHIFEMYGPDSRKPGTFASNCLLARRLVERNVRFVQLFHRGWDHHTKLPSTIRDLTSATDQPSAALLKDLKQRGLLDETLVVWGGEFGRTVYCQGRLTTEDYGRDHHPRCFTVWLAGGGIKAGISDGKTDDYSYNITENPVHVHDLHATLLHCLGIEHTQLTYKYQGRRHRLTDVAGNVLQDILV
ncbi:MAG: DUF1501 domain-containing protein [Planctomycetota bacterium]|nr:DUF1501 domain-containing protein [Planctomycetota bacterium]